MLNRAWFLNAESNFSLVSAYIRTSLASYSKTVFFQSNIFFGQYKCYCITDLRLKVSGGHAIQRVFELCLESTFDRGRAVTAALDCSWGVQ
jgi:hypothetical protein